jgi:hypothetical protein
MFGLEPEPVRNGPEQHFGYLDPICGVVRHEECLKIVATAEIYWRPLIHFLRDNFKETYRNVTVKK